MASLHLFALLVAAAALVEAQRGGGQLSNRAILQYVFDRPMQPMYYPKGENGEVSFQLPMSYVPKRYQRRARELKKKFTGEMKIKVPKVQVPDISFPKQLGRRSHFSPFIPYHRRMAESLVNVLLGMRTYEDFVSASVYCRDQVNPSMFAYAMSIATLHRSDAQGAPLPSFVSRFPEKFFDGDFVAQVYEEANMVDTEDRVPIVIPRNYTASGLEPESRIDYWREDVGFALHHWHWHLVYPNIGNKALVMKDRRGELFYYSHQQIIARYNFERFANGMGRVQSFINWHDPIPEAYFPKLDSPLASRTWASRPANCQLSDVHRPDLQVKFKIQELELWREHIYAAISKGRVETENGTIPLDERNGINILGNLLEAHPHSVNPKHYGNLHNFGHFAIAVCHDPDYHYMEPIGVMGALETAVRDPIFYRWHSFVNDVFEQHKRTLVPYTLKQLGFEGITVGSVEVRTKGVNQPNIFSTFYQQNHIDLSKGLDFSSRGPVLIELSHLQHSPFQYRIQVENRGAPRVGTVRIFMAPRFDERGTPLLFSEQRHFFIELDKFHFKLQPGANTIRRRSDQSSVSIPYESTFRDISEVDTLEGEPQEKFDHSGCGWPQHLLIPRGSQEGMEADLFVMISNAADEQVDQQQLPSALSRGHSYCGVFRQLYPDGRSMGYPFDREPREKASTLSEFLTPNMRVQHVTILFNDTVPYSPISETAQEIPRAKPKFKSSKMKRNKYYGQFE